MKINDTLRILLLSSPTFIGSFLLNILTDQPAKALEVTANPIPSKNQPTPQANLQCDRPSCTGNNHLAAYDNLINGAQSQNEEQFPNVERNEDGHLILNVSEEESDAAVALFGCDCVKALNALRQLRGIPIGVEGDRILPGPMIRPCTQRLPDA
jgi:hypothetical protein